MERNLLGLEWFKLGKYGLLLISMLGLGRASAQIRQGDILCNFGVDGDVKSNTSRFGNGVGQSNTDDWFKFSSPSGSGRYVIDTTGGSSQRQLLLTGGTSANTAFDRNMYVSRMSLVDGYRYMDGKYGRDHNSAATNKDSSGFVGSNKNTDNISNWTYGNSNITPKNDIIDVYSHLRRASYSMKDSLYLFAALSTTDVNGARYLDVEYFKGVLSKSSGSFTSTGTQYGHTPWTLDANGNVTQTGDMIISVDYNGSGGQPDIYLRIFVSQTDFNKTPAKFSWVSGSFSKVGGNSSNYGYAKIVLPWGAGLANYNSGGIGDTTWATPWGTISNTGAYSDTYASNQLVEVGLNLTLVGIDPALYANLGMQPCDAFFYSMVFKSRTSQSFTSTLTDFAGPYTFGGLATVPAVIVGDTIRCNASSIHLTADSMVAGALYDWSAVSGSISSIASDSSYMVTSTPGVYVLSTSPSNECTSNNTDTFVVLIDTITPNLNSSSAASVSICSGVSASIILSVPNLLDSFYNFTYSLSGANTSSGNTLSAKVISGSVTLTVPLALISNPGTTVFTLNSVQKDWSGCTNSSLGNAIQASIVIAPNTTGLALSGNDICSSNGTTVSIYAPNLTNGNYTFVYNLSAPNAASGISTSVSISSGIGIISLAPSAIPSIGTTTLTVVSVTDVTSGCTKSGLSVSATIGVHGCGTINGTVYNDANGVNDALLNGTGVGSVVSTQLFANLVDSDGNIFQSVVVGTNGTYSFSNVWYGTYNIQISTNQGVVASPAPSVSIPVGWVNTAEGTGIGDGLADGSYSITLASSLSSNNDFGINQIPIAYDKTLSVPGIQSQGTILSLDTLPMTGLDLEDGAISVGRTFRIDSLPADATLLYNGIPLNEGDTIQNYSPTLLTLSLNTLGMTSTQFYYSLQDSAGFWDASPALYVVVLQNPLPVKLVYFNGKVVSENAVLSWKSATEINLQFYQIEHSSNGVTFESLGRMEAMGSNQSYR